MPHTVNGIIYATGSKIIRRIVIPDDDAQLALHVGPGETLLTLPKDQPHHLHAARAAVTAKTGVTPPSGRCAVVHPSGAVVGAIHADPALDSVPGHTLIPHETASEGHHWDGTTFTAPASANPDKGHAP